MLAAPLKPNIVLILPDQLRAQEVACYGESGIASPVSTPNLDMLAASGIRFRYACSSFPLCTPCRSSIMTGRMPFSVKSSTPGEPLMVKNALRLDVAEITVAEQLKDLGYACGYVGKWHLDDIANLECIPPERRQGFDWFEGYNAYGGQTDAKYFDSSCVLQSSTEWLPDVNTDSAIRFITDHQGGPFFVMIAYGPPHAPAGVNWSEFIPPDAVFTPDRMYLWDMFSTAAVNLRPNVSVFDPDPVHQLQMYHAMAKGIDDQIARIRSTLSSLGIENNTILMMSSDHGSEHGSHGDWDKNSIWEEAIRVPLVVYDPRNATPAVVTSPVVSMDIMPTIVELAGGTPLRAQGRSFAAAVTGAGGYVPRDAVLVQIRQTKIGSVNCGRTRALRTQEWKLAACETPDNSCNFAPQALFDLQNDPYELNNLVNNPSYANIQQQLWSRMVQEMRSVDDPLLCGLYPYLQVAPASIERNALVFTNLPNDTFTVTNVGPSTLTYKVITDGASWLGVSPDTGTSTDETDIITITYNTAALLPGDYHAAIEVASSTAINSPQALSVTVRVGVPPELTRAAIDLGGHFDSDAGVDIEAGLRRPIPEPADGDTIWLLRDGRNCRRVSDPSLGDHAIYFRVDNQYAYQGSRPDLYVTIDYYDRGNNTIQLQYDSASNAYADGGSFTTSDTQTWLQHTFHVTDAWFGDRQDGQCDYRVYRQTGFLLLDVVQIGPSAPPPPEILLSATGLKRRVQQGGSPATESFTVRNIGGGKLAYAVASSAGWLQVSPTGGAGVGELDPIQLTYASATLAPGRYAGHAQVTDGNAANSPQALAITLSVLTPAAMAADLDQDGDVDVADFQLFQACASGAGNAQASSACAACDWDEDQDVDLDDFGAFQRCIGGIDRAPGC